MTPEEERRKMMEHLHFDEGQAEDLTPEEARKRMLRYLRLDAEGDDDGDDEERDRGNDSKPHYGNTRLPYGLCKRFGIDLPEDAKPRDAWAALEKGTGYTHDEVMEIVERTGSTKGVGKGSKGESAGKGTTGKTSKGTPAVKVNKMGLGKGRPLVPIEIPKHTTLKECTDYCKERFGEESDLSTEGEQFGFTPEDADKLMGAFGSLEDKFGVDVEGIRALDNNVPHFMRSGYFIDQRSPKGMYIEDEVLYVDRTEYNLPSDCTKEGWAEVLKDKKEKAAKEREQNEKRVQEAKAIYEKYKNNWNGYGEKYHPEMERTHDGENSFRYWQMIQTLVPDAEKRYKEEKKELDDNDRIIKNYENHKNLVGHVADPERPMESTLYKVVGDAIAKKVGSVASKYSNEHDALEVSVAASEGELFSECFTGCMLGLDMPQWCYDMMDEAKDNLKEQKKKRDEKVRECAEREGRTFKDCDSDMTFPEPCRLRNADNRFSHNRVGWRLRMGNPWIY